MSLQLFTLNEVDSLYERCSHDDFECEEEHWDDRIPYWRPKLEVKIIHNLQTSQNMWTDIDALVDHKRYDGLKKAFRKHPEKYLNRLLPTFDLVVVNSGQQSAVLSAIELRILYSEPLAQGDSEERSSASHVLPVLHRYEIRIPEQYSQMQVPFNFSVPAIPPLSIKHDDPARFQVTIDSFVNSTWVYEMKIKLHFGPKQLLETDTFRLNL